MEQLVPMVRALIAEAGVDAAGYRPSIGAAGLATLGEALRAELPGALAREFGVGDGRAGRRRRDRVRRGARARARCGGRRRHRADRDRHGSRRAGVARTAGAICSATAAAAPGSAGPGWRRRCARTTAGEGGSAAAAGAAPRRCSARCRGCPAAVSAPRPAAPCSPRSRPGWPRCAADDPVAAGILRAAARHMADSAAAVCPSGRRAAAIALTGGLFKMGGRSPRPAGGGAGAGGCRTRGRWSGRGRSAAGFGAHRDRSGERVLACVTCCTWWPSRMADPPVRPVRQTFELGPDPRAEP